MSEENKKPVLSETEYARIKAVKEAEEKTERLRSAYYRILRTDDGKIIEADLRNFCGQDRSSVCEEHPDALQTAYCEGKRRVYLRIKEMAKKKGEKNE